MKDDTRPPVLRRSRTARVVLKVVLGAIFVGILLLLLFSPFLAKKASVMAINTLQEKLNGKLEFESVTSNRNSISITNLAVYASNESSPIFKADKLTVFNINRILSKEVDIRIDKGELLISRDKSGKANIQDIFKKPNKPSDNNWKYHINIRDSILVYHEQGQIISRSNVVKIPDEILSRCGLTAGNSNQKPFRVNTRKLEGNLTIYSGKYVQANLEAELSNDQLANYLGSLHFKCNFPISKSPNNKRLAMYIKLSNLNASVIMPLLHQAVPSLEQASIASDNNIVDIEVHKNNRGEFYYKAISDINIHSIALPQRPIIGPAEVKIRYNSAKPEAAQIRASCHFGSSKSKIECAINNLANLSKTNINTSFINVPVNRLREFIPELRLNKVDIDSFSGNVQVSELKPIVSAGNIQLTGLSLKGIPVGNISANVAVKDQDVNISRLAATGPTINLLGSGKANIATKNISFVISSLQIASSLVNSLAESNVKVKDTITFKGDLGVINNKLSATGTVSGLSLESGSWSLNNASAELSLTGMQMAVHNLKAETTFKSKLLNWTQKRYALPDLASITGDLVVNLSPDGNFELASGSGQVKIRSTFASKFDDSPTFGEGRWTLQHTGKNVSSLTYKAPVRYRGKNVSLDLQASIRSRGLSNARLMLKRDEFNAEIRAQFDIRKPKPSGGFMIQELDIERFSPSYNLAGKVSTSGSFNMDGKYFNINGTLHSDALQYNKLINNNKLEPIKNINFVFDYKSEKCQFSAADMSFKGHPLNLKGRLEHNYLDVNLTSPNLSIAKIAGCLVDLKYCQMCTLDNMRLQGEGDLELNVKGSFAKSLVSLSYKPTDVEVTNREFDRVRVLAHTFVALDKKIPPDYVVLDSLEITGANGSLAASGLVPVINSGELAIEGKMQDFDIEIFSAFLPKLGITRAKIASLEKASLPITNLSDYDFPPALAGKINGEVKVSGTLRRPNGSAKLRLDRGHIFSHLLKNGVIDITINEAGIRLDKLQLEVNEALIEGSGLLAKNIRESVFNIRTTAFDLAVLQPFLGYKLKGTMELDISKQPNTSGMTGNIIGHQIVVAGIGFRTVSIRFETLGQDYMHIISANLRPQPLGNDVALGNFQLTGKIPLGVGANAVDSNGNPLNLDLNIKIPHIQIEQLLALYPKLNVKCKGEVVGDGKITGTYADPIPNVHLQGLIKNIRLPGGLELKAVQMNSHIRHKDFDLEFYNKNTTSDLADTDDNNTPSGTNQILGVGGSNPSEAVLAAKGTYTLNPLKVFTVNAEFNPEQIEVIRVNNVVNGRMTGRISVDYNAQTNWLSLSGFSTIKSGSRLFVSPLAAGLAVDPKLPKLDMNLTLTIEKGCTMEFAPVNFHSGLYGKVKFGGSMNNLQASGKIYMKGGSFDLYRQRFRFIDEVEASNINFSSVDGLMPRITAKATTTIRRSATTTEDGEMDVFITMNQTRLDQLNEATLTSEPPRGKDTIIAALTGNLTNIPKGVNILDSVLREELIALSMSRLSREVEDILNLDRFEFVWYSDRNYFVDLEKRIYPNLYLSYSRALSKDWVKPEELIGLRYSLLKQGAFNVSGIAKYDINGNTTEGHRAGLQVTHRFDSPFAKGENSPPTASENYVDLNPYNFDYKLEFLKQSTIDSSVTESLRPLMPHQTLGDRQDSVPAVSGDQVDPETERYSED